MEWQKLEFVDIFEEEDNYKYVFGVLARSTFKKNFLVVEFASVVPHYRWTDIQETMVKAEIFVDDLVNGELRDLGIGQISYAPFTAAEIEKYGTDVAIWKVFREEALGNQRKLCDEYSEVWGEPDLPDTVKWR